MVYSGLMPAASTRGLEGQIWSTDVLRLGGKKECHAAGATAAGDGRVDDSDKENARFLHRQQTAACQPQAMQQATQQQHRSGTAIDSHLQNKQSALCTVAREGCVGQHSRSTVPSMPRLLGRIGPLSVPPPQFGAPTIAAPQSPANAAYATGAPTDSPPNAWTKTTHQRPLPPQVQGISMQAPVQMPGEPAKVELPAYAPKPLGQFDPNLPMKKRPVLKGAEALPKGNFDPMLPLKKHVPVSLTEAR